MMNVLFEGWTKIPHSYAIVLCFQLIGIYNNNNTKNKINIYIKETEYFFEKWNLLKLTYKDIYPEEYANILENILEKSNKEYNNDNNQKSKPKIDLIYRISYPYNITMDNTNITIPKCVFYTSEFSQLDLHYFKYPNKITNKEQISKYINTFKNLYFTGPSNWSTNGLKLLSVDDKRNRVITHGVSNKIFYKSPAERIEMRTKNGFSDDDIVILNMGAFTPNKGIIFLFALIYDLVITHKKTNYKLVLKGLQDLYQFEEFLNMYIGQIAQNTTIDVIKDLINKGHIRFISNTLSFDEMRRMYNMSDIYISPYLAEGFNITPLEALSCGTFTMVPKTGSTSGYIDDILKNVPNAPIGLIESSVIQNDSGYQNKIDVQDMFLKVYNYNNKKYNYEELKEYLEKKYSWEHVADLLYDYFTDITSTS